MSTPEQSTVKDYLTILEKYKQIYGQKTALFYQVGAFIEMYALQSEDGVFTANEELENVSQLCNLALVPKKQMYNKMRVFMSGNREYLCEKYLNILSDAGYTSVVYTQHKDGSKFVRRLECIVSSGTHVTYDTDTNTQHSNYIMAIWIERVNIIGSGQQNFVIGLSAANIFTGKTYIFEYSVAAACGGAAINPTQFDELERQISTFSPSEIIIISNLDRIQLESIIKFSNIRCSLIHYIDSNENEKAKNCMKQKYIHHVLSTYFNDGDILFKCAELQTHVLATQSFCYLLDFIYEHNPNLLKNIHLPVIQNTSTRLILGNQTLRQLNIIEDTGNADSRRAGKFSSVLHFLNDTKTPMGRRLFQQQFVSPVFDEEWLTAEYDIIDYVLSPDKIHLVDYYRGELAANFRDLEKINRQIMMRKIYPTSIYQLYSTIYAAMAIAENMSDNMPELLDYAPPYTENMKDFVEMCEKTLYLDICKTVTSMTTFEENIFRRGICSQIDETEDKYKNSVAELENIQRYLSALLCGAGGATAADDECIKVHETDKQGISFQTTKRRAAILKTALSKVTAEDLHPAAKDIKISSGAGSAEEITSPLIRECTRNIVVYRQQLNDLVSNQYRLFLENLENNYYTTIDSTAVFVAKIDVVFCKAFVANKYNYCRPKIAGADSAAAASVRARNMRHVLIEHINQNEVYVPNDVEINGSDGLLIYGVNTTGKTSYIRSVGISIIMAQTGMFVPCDEFIYKPYRSIFSRILGNDNLFHGLSTFAVEMSELRVILKMADPYTLIIGDEVCSGTENQSALSIFVAALVQLCEKQCSFLFATHFHEILEYDEIRNMPPEKLKIKHMSVCYDREKDVLVYERKLRDGPGHRMYGIEICKSLHMPADFIEMAYSLRNKYFKETAGALSHTTSSYNSAKIRGLCENCGERMSEETHHIYQQKFAGKMGYISDNSDVFHKDHAGNLMVLCEKCHDKIHAATPVPAGGEKKKKRKTISLSAGGGGGVAPDSSKITQFFCSKKI